MNENVEDKTCFVICPIGAENSIERKNSDVVFQYIILPATEECGYAATRSIDQDRPGLISSDIINSIVNSSMVIADLTGQNPNVFYELAIRHMVRKPCLILCEKETKIPFDVSHNQVIRYSLNVDEAAEAKDRLVKQIFVAESDPRSADNLVTNAIMIEELRRGSQPQDRRDAMILERLEGLSLDVQGLADEVRKPENGQYMLATSGVGESKTTTLSIEDSNLPGPPPFTKWFAEENPGYFISLIKENNIFPRREQLLDFWETEEGVRYAQQLRDSD